ncbi:MAG: protein kinase [Phycisphaerae bacterium]
MTPERYERIRRMFLDLRDASPAERARYLARECGADPQLRSDVEALLADAQSADSFLSSPVLGSALRGIGFGPQNLVAATSTSEAVAPPFSPRSIGPYKILEQIGEGGFGTVYLAQQTEPVARRVALKVIKRGMDSREVIARFEAERHALALMDHPNIARVLDAGQTDDGRP